MISLNNPLLEYYQAIQNGSVIVGHFIRLWYEQIIDGLQKKRFFFDLKKANRAIRFIESFLHHHEGELAPGLVKLELWQKATLAVIFGIVDADGLRQFREVVIIMGRKNGKTLLAAGIAEYLAFLGDYGALVVFAAPKLDQASLCFNATHQSILQEPELSALAKKRRADIYIQQNNATLKPIAYNSKTSDGMSISLAVCDEIAAWGGNQGLKMYEVLASSTGARKEPLILSISTAGYVNGSIYDELVKRGTRVILGGSRESRLAPFFYMIDDLNKWNDISELQKANPNLGVSLSVPYLVEQIAIAEGSLSKKAEFICKTANIKQNSSQAWLPTEAVELCCGDHLTPEMFAHSYCVGGIDLSQTVDLTCCMVLLEKDGIINVLAQFFMPSERIDEAAERDGVPYRLYVQKGILTPSGDNFVDYHDCFQWFTDMVEKHEILPLQIGYDRYSAQYLIQDLKAYGFHTDDVFQGYNLTPVINECTGLIKDGKINIGDNELLKMHFLDSALKMNTETNQVKLIKMRQTSHIDGMAAFLDAMTVRQKWNAEIGEQLKNQ